LLVLAALVGGVSVDSLGAGVVAVLVIGFLTSIVWPVVVRFALPVLVYTVGAFSFVMNGALIWLASGLVPGFEVSTFWTGFVVAALLTGMSVLVGSLLRVDDDDEWHRKVVMRAVRDSDRFAATDEPGVIFLQIDGLSLEVLREALLDGHCPMMDSMIKEGSHHLFGWECDLSSQTGAMQAGILLGNNQNMPAFRWYDKPSGRVLVSNSPSDAAEIEEAQSSGRGLLADGGVSRGNVFSGDASDSLFTFSQLKPGGGPKQRLVSLFATPSGVVRIVGLFVVDIGRELRSARRARREGVEPHGHRGGIYPLLRAAVTVGLTEITTATLAGDIYRGVPAAYVDFVGYDEVAHHSGIRRPESLAVLRRIDERIRRLTLGFDAAPRPYQLVILSDHGQTQGATFLQRYEETLEGLVGRLANGKAVIAPGQVTEGWGNVNGLLTNVAQDGASVSGRVIRRALRRRMKDGEVEFGRGRQDHPDLDQAPGDDEIIVLASGNLGLVSFTEIGGRATLEEIEFLHPGLLQGLVEHPGIGFVMVRSGADGIGLVMGRHGVHHLSDGRIEGLDPLLAFGENAADHLSRTDTFTNCPDLIVNSFYCPETDEGAAFEELIGFHGGIGGLQAKPFVLAPVGMAIPDAPIVGAEQVHHLFRQWMADLREPARSDAE